MPSSVLHHLRKGSFSVRLSPSEWHGVALDACHEMKINKDAKLAVIHPSKYKMEFLSKYMAFHSSCVHNQLFPEREGRQAGFHSPTGQDKKKDVNMTGAIESKSMTALPACGLWNFLEVKEATLEQAHDLLQCRHIGQQAFERYVSTKIIGLPSTNAPNLRKRLVTFSVTNVDIFSICFIIAGGSEAPGSIGDVTLDEAYMSFFHLVGATYFRARASAFNFTAPVTLYHSVTASNSVEKHEKWLGIIRKAIWLRADTESPNIPSTAALKLHWTRCSWVLKMWHKSFENDMDMPGMLHAHQRTVIHMHAVSVKF